MDENNFGLRKLLRNASIYDTFQNILGAKKCRKILVSQYFDLLAGMSVLDLGCGTGEILNFLPDGVRYTGIDYNQKYIESAQIRFSGKGRFLCSDLTQILNENEKYERVILTGFLHHINDGDAQKLLRKAHLAVKSGGFLICIENVRTEPQNLVARYLIDKDRGQHVRYKEGYIRLFDGLESSLETVIRTDLLRVPYAHLIIRSRVK